MTEQTLLPHDVCRCHDAHCAVRYDCARYLQSATGTFHAQSIRGVATDEPCRFFIADHSGLGPRSCAGIFLRGANESAET